MARSSNKKTKRTVRPIAKRVTKTPPVETRIIKTTGLGVTVFYVVCVLVLLFGAFLLIPNRSKTPPAATLQTQTITYQGVDGKKALELLKQNHKVESQSYDFGEFVTAIDGQVAPQGYYWAFYINDALADQGADQLQTKNSDRIRWQLDKIE